jgi:single-strand DNA-binding protein
MFKAFGVGRLVHDPELKAVNDTHVCQFSMAINEYRKINGERKEYTHFFDFVVWDKGAELVAQYCKKGDLLEVSASPRQEKWSDKETGASRSKVTFRVDEFRFINTGRKVDATAPVEEEKETEEVAEPTPF